MKFSIVMPVFNKKASVGRAIGSVLSQTHKDFELLLVDDASTDGSAEEIARFRDSRIRVLHRDRPGAGGYAARNLGITHSEADWVAFLDADDEWLPDHLEALRELVTGSRGGIVATGWLVDHGDNVRKSRGFAVFQARDDIRVLDFTAYLKEVVQGRFPIWTGAVAVKRSLLRSVGGFPDWCKRGGDTALWLHLMNVAGELVVSSRPTAVYHRGDSFVTAKTPPEVKDNCVCKACRQLLREVSNKRVSRLLMQVSNIHVGYGIRARARAGSLRFSDCDDHFFLVDWKEHLWFRFLSLVPRWIQLGARAGLLTARNAITDAPRGGKTSKQ